MKLTEISILTVKRKDRLPLLLILGAMLWVAALQVESVNAQGLPDILSTSAGHRDLADTAERDQSMKSFVSKNSKGLKKSSTGGSVHIVYLVPSDKRRRRDYIAGMKTAILELQAFYQDELGITRSKVRKAVGETFNTFLPTVQVVRTPHDSAYYNANNQAGQFEFFSELWETASPLPVVVSMIPRMSGFFTSMRIQLAARESAGQAVLRCFRQMI
jgi:hypothetical protein